MDARVLLLIALSGCAHRPPTRIVEPVRVVIPVAVRREPPPELLAPYRAEELPVFVAPGDSRATSCLTAQGERELRALLSDLAARDEAWRSWAEK